MRDDRDEDAAGREVERHEQRTDDRRADDPRDPLVHVQCAEEHETDRHGDESVSGDAEDESGNGEAEEQFLDDARVDRERGTVGELRPVAGEERLDVADRRHRVDLPREDDGEHSTADESEGQADQNADSETGCGEALAEGSHPRVPVDLGQQERHELPHQDEHHDG